MESRICFGTPNVHFFDYEHPSRTRLSNFGTCEYLYEHARQRTKHMCFSTQKYFRIRLSNLGPGRVNAWCVGMPSLYSSKSSRSTPVKCLTSKSMQLWCLDAPF
jgi:hypothetical protein